MEDSLSAYFIKNHQDYSTDAQGIDWFMTILDKKVTVNMTSSADATMYLIMCTYFDFFFSECKRFFRFSLDCKKHNEFHYNSGLKYGRALSNCRYQEMDLTV